MIWFLKAMTEDFDAAFFVYCIDIIQSFLQSLRLLDSSLLFTPQQISIYFDIETIDG